ncbi:MAG: heme biosynthesis HemY N-terminal domain-containing protein [Alphaproteobacteria bacterium]|nr:heme biosynthesis HemY N-terminal domain-containing protein [Alphaproteobacteria bacterium]
MTKFFFFFALIILLSVCAAWFADHPGSLTLHWNGYILETSLLIGALLSFILLLLVSMFMRCFRFLWAAPQKIRGAFDHYNQTRGYRALSRGMIAVCTGEVTVAAHCAKKTLKILKNHPLSLLLTAQTAQLKNDKETAKRVFGEMLSSPETRMLGLHGLFIGAWHQNDRETAEEMAQKALDQAPRTAWAAEALFELQCRAEAWKKALKTLAQNHKNELISKTAFLRMRAILLTAHALECEKKDTEKATKLSMEAHTLAPGLVPAATLAGRLLIQQGKDRKASKIIKKTWQQNAHPDIANLYSRLHAKETSHNRLKYMERFSSQASDKKEGAIALARAAIDARQWAMARTVLLPHAKNAPNRTICLLLAKIEDGEFGKNNGKTREWLARAAYARQDPMWIADGVASSTWKPISAITGQIDAFQWQPPPGEIRITPNMSPDPKPAPDPDPDPDPDPLKNIGNDEKKEKTEITQNQAFLREKISPQKEKDEPAKMLSFSPNAPDNPLPETELKTEKEQKKGRSEKQKKLRRFGRKS